ncbi:MAG: NAD(P)/FAD-dependent oxidoreductase [Candidatus Neomarinimicrobiota bacterium]|nr:NAD(P)/FAD-dependent oxidoreductase [Candidatus Neomarinimicrobiota bacterium]
MAERDSYPHHDCHVHFQRGHTPEDVITNVDYDIIIIGAGVMGLAVARALAVQGETSVLIVEKEMGFGQGISSRNSEVIHSGIYYPTNSLKAKYCLGGRDPLYAFCRENDVWNSKCGKLVVAQAGQESQLETLHRQAEANGVPELHMMTRSEIAQLEPEVSAESAMFIGCTGIVSAHELMSAYHRVSAEADHDLLLKTVVVGADRKDDSYALEVEGPGDAAYTVTARWVVNAAGLQSDRIAQFLWGTDDPSRPVLRYSKGAYFKMSGKWRHRVERLVYPLPDTEHDSLGIHLSFDQAGDMKLGPDATWIDDRSADYTVDASTLDLFYREAKLYLPALERHDLSPDYSGIRPKLVETADGNSDFYIRHEPDNPGWINLIGIDSPGLTAALAIGEEVTRWILS